MRITLPDPLSHSQWQAIEDAALSILERTGLLVAHSEILSLLGQHKGVRIDGQVVRFEPCAVREHVASVKGCNEYDTHAICGCYAHNYLDPDTAETRHPTLEDLVRSVCQAEALGQGVCCPVVPMDVPGPQQEIVMERITHENARGSYGGGQATTVVAAEAAIEMSAVVGRPHSLEVWVTSPLNLDPGGLDMLWKLRHRRPNVRISNMPVQGLSAPVSVAGLLALTTAEIFGAATVLGMLGLCNELSYRVDAFWGYAVDMRSANVLLSGPDYLRLMTLSTFLAQRHGIKAPMAKSLLTASKQPDEQAAAEKAAQGLVSALAGAGTFAAAGSLSGVETFSPLQMIIDLEILGWLDAYVRPLDVAPNDEILEVIHEVGPGGMFMGHPSTAARCRDAFWQPGLFTMNSTSGWKAEGQPSLLEKAREKLNSLPLASEPIVSAEQQRELARLEQEFLARL